MILITEEERATEEQKRKRYLFFYIVITCVFVAAVLTMFFLSPHEYTGYLVGNILLSIVYGFYSVWFFTVAYPYVGNRSRLFDKVLSAREGKEYGVFLKKGDPITTDGVEMVKYHFTVYGDEREVNVIRPDLDLTVGKRYVLDVRAGVLFSIGEADE